jgi:putative SOS response-associated peptidase YedK
MPAILRPEDYERWVFEDCETALKDIGPYPAQMMTAVKLGPATNSSRNDGADLLIPCA